ncbi:DENN domain-containing protein 1A-like isoform X3 [Polyodon spathula]|uniref:DENN domain-containing protein 1A-like isoform X3 n=1 Tax=Polyodon spathula TaxID=7913 RepID=UPI001B7EB36B|nr:DENN domain-containing protein 1A-like isoform X3 [Polyodon spathula]
MGSRIKGNTETAFEVYVEVTHPGSSSSDPEVRRQFPDDYSDQEVLQTLTRFCFPFCADSLTVSQVGQNFTFVLTDIDSKQRFGFCRLSSGARSCFCILSYLPWFEVFYKLLNILADYTAKGQDSQWKELLNTLHTLPIPEPGVPVHLSVHSYFTVPDIRELPSIPENRNLTEYFVAVDVNNMLHLYASMLYERRILICCSKLSTLTACVHGSAAMLYPMYWQHVYIPVLPQHLIDYCCAPMPYLIGVHSSLMERVKSMALEDVVVLNVDTNTLETPFDDLQSLPNDVVSSLKNRLKKVSTTTGDGVAHAFLKAQAALFGSYRNALKIEPEEPITFSEEAFVSHRSSAMRQFLQNAIQLQLFKQFIDGRLDLLNSGKGFSDVFEEEINMGEYAGSDKTYHQWLFTVKKGSGAIINTVKTKANPAMKTVYKFAKDHARMGIKEVKNRLKQKDIAENGYSAAMDETQPKLTASPLTERKEGKQREERRPITVHFGQARPSRPPLVKRPGSNVVDEGGRTLVSSPEHMTRPTRHYTVFLSEDDSGDELQPEHQSVSGFSENFLFSAPFEWPQPYKTLKEADIAEAEKGMGHTAPPSPVASQRITEINLLGDIFSSLDVDSEKQPLSQAKSLEDLRTPKEEGPQQVKFGYQRMDPGSDNRTRTLPGMKHSNPYNKLWSVGQDDMSTPPNTSLSSSERLLAVRPAVSSEQQRPPSTEGTLEKTENLSSSQSNITIPRPHGRKTPELGKVLPPPVPVPQVGKHPPLAGAVDSGKTSSSSDLVSGFSQEIFGTKASSHEFRQALNASPLPMHSSAPDILKPIKVSSESVAPVDLLSLLDPLSTGVVSQSSSQTPSPGNVSAPTVSSSPALFTVSSSPALFTSDFSLPASTYSQQLGYPPPGVAQFPPSSLNPFTKRGLHYPATAPPGAHYVGPARNPFSSNYMSPNVGFFQAPARPHFAAPSVPGLFGQPSALGQASGAFIHQSPSPVPPSYGQAMGLGSTSSSSNLHDSAKTLLDHPLIPTKPVHARSDSPLPPSRSQEEPQDPFEDVLNVMKDDIVVPGQGRVVQLRKRWETFE